MFISSETFYTLKGIPDLTRNRYPPEFSKIEGIPQWIVLRIFSHFPPPESLSLLFETGGHFQLDPYSAGSDSGIPPFPSFQRGTGRTTGNPKRWSRQRRMTRELRAWIPLILGVSFYNFIYRRLNAFPERLIHPFLSGCFCLDVRV